MQKIPRTIKSKSVYKNDYVDIKVDTVIFNGNQWDQVYFVKPNKDGVSVLPIDENGIYLVKQYRHACKKLLWQIPMGMMEKGATELETAKNELAEEAGIVAKKFIKIGSLLAEPGMSNQEEFVYVAKDLTFKKQKPEIFEIGMQVKHFTFDEIKQMIKDGKLKCGFTLSVLNLFYNNYLK